MDPQNQSIGGLGGGMGEEVYSIYIYHMAPSLVLKGVLTWVYECHANY